MVPLLSPKQVGVLLNISGRQVLRLGIPQIRLGRRTIRFRMADVEAYMNTHLTGAYENAYQN